MVTILEHMVNTKEIIIQHQNEKIRQLQSEILKEKYLNQENTELIKKQNKSIEDQFHFIKQQQEIIIKKEQILFQLTKENSEKDFLIQCYGFGLYFLNQNK